MDQSLEKLTKNCHKRIRLISKICIYCKWLTKFIMNRPVYMSMEKRKLCFWLYFDEVHELIFRRKTIKYKPFMSPASQVLKTVCEIAERYSWDRGCKPQDSSGRTREPQSWIKMRLVKMTALHPPIWPWISFQGYLKRKKESYLGLIFQLIIHLLFNINV